MSEEFVILVDTREQTPFTFGSAPTKLHGLPTGDYSLLGHETEVSIERKELGDLIGCISQERERFVRELERLTKFPLRRVVIQATMQDVVGHRYRSRTHPSSVIGSIISWEVQYDIPFVWAGIYGAAYTLRLLEKWHKYAEKERINGKSSPA